MNWISVIAVAAGTFGLCYLFDKGYARVFRSKVQHRSGLAVRISRRYAVFGIMLGLLGVAALLSSIANGLALLIGGIIALLMGAGLIVYYMTFGVFYDEDTFLLTTFGRKSITYRFSDIKTQQLYLLQGGNVIIELYLQDGRALSLQSGMEGIYLFLDHAFKAWCRQTGRKPEDCSFHDPSSSIWFPVEEV